MPILQRASKLHTPFVLQEIVECHNVLRRAMIILKRFDIDFLSSKVNLWERYLWEPRMQLKFAWVSNMRSMF
jgi:hypothetical protein